MKKLLVIAGFAALLFATACMPIDNPEKKYSLQITAENLAGTWEGSVDRDRAQGYYQKWRFKFEGNNYTFWHTYQTSGTINDDVQGIKTVGSKEKGTWACENGNLVLLGRSSDMMKINGNRVEPGEIENVVKRLLNIDWAAAKGIEVTLVSAGSPARARTSFT